MDSGRSAARFLFQLSAKASGESLALVRKHLDAPPAKEEEFAYALRNAYN